MLASSSGIEDLAVSVGATTYTVRATAAAASYQGESLAVYCTRRASKQPVTRDKPEGLRASVAETATVIRSQRDRADRAHPAPLICASADQRPFKRGWPPFACFVTVARKWAPSSWSDRKHRAPCDISQLDQA
ncbi:hypothetical protein MTO96_020631 [Rhipicephalus appendiculatus]